MFSALTLSNQPVLPNQASNQHFHTDGRARSDAPKPVFGLTSLSSVSHISEIQQMNGGAGSADVNAMIEDYDQFDDENAYNDDGEERNHDPNAMDWSPISPDKRSQVQRHSFQPLHVNGGNGAVYPYPYPYQSQPHRPPQQQQMARKQGQGGAWDDGSWMRPQRFFVPEEPTGLEGLFEQTISLSDDDRLAGSKGMNGNAGEGKSQWLDWVKGRWTNKS